jgi:hypothetical protein
MVLHKHNESLAASLDRPLTSVPKTIYAVEPRAKALSCDYQDINNNHDGLIAK